MRVKYHRWVKKGTRILLFMLFVLGTIWGLYQVSTPERYDLSPGEISPADIYTPRQIIDKRATEQRAQQMAENVVPVSLRSTEISDAALADLRDFFDEVDQLRNEYYVKPRAEEAQGEVNEASSEGEGNAAAEPRDAAENGVAENAQGGSENAEGESTAPESTVKALSILEQEELRARLEDMSTTLFAFELNPMTADNLASLEPATYDELKHKGLSIGEKLMEQTYDRRGLDGAITQEVSELMTMGPEYSQDFESLAVILRYFLRPNQEFDNLATQAARDAAYEKGMNDPVRIEPGTRIVKAGESLSPLQFEQLKELDLLLDQQFDWLHLGALSLHVLFLLLIALVYALGYDRRHFADNNSLYTLLLAAALTFAAALILVRNSSLLIPVIFFAILCTTYYGLRASLVFSSLMTMLFLPLVPGDQRYVFVALLSVWIVSLVTAINLRRNNFTSIIIVSTLAPAFAIGSYGFLFGQGWEQITSDLIYGFLNGGLSSVFAIGIMPLVEFSRSTVAPTKLIALSEPSNPLLKRLFLEAPGTNQHSQMVANLAAAAAESIGADALLTRVGAYYHDIGKLENPLMFTENQHEINPHDQLAPEESYRIIIAHVEDGLRMARRNRLPEPLQAMIREHHGTTVLSYFYQKACEQAKEQGKPKPNRDDFRYPWNIPQSKEAAILMLADSTEAAMKSTKTDNLEDMQILARKIVKSKIEDDQLVASGLSFQDVEDILEAFAQVYLGQFHERVTYPDDETDEN